MNNETEDITAGLVQDGEALKNDPRYFLEQDEWIGVDISGDWLDPTKGYEKPKYTLSYNGSKFAPLGGIHSMTGQPGNGKTMTFAQFMVATLRGEWDGIKYELQDERPDPSVLYVDTEMELGNTQLVMLRVYEMMEWEKGKPYDRFKVLRLRETDQAEDRWRKILKAIYELKDVVTAVYIDGLLDVVADFNKNDECQEIIYKCMKTSSHYGISLWCLVHENPGTTKMVGHLGSMLERKVTDSFATVKEKAPDGTVTFTIKQKKARGRDVDDIKYHIVDGANGFGIPRQMDQAIQEPEVEKVDPMKLTKEEKTTFAVATITSQDGITKRSLRNAIMKEYHIGSTKADAFITELCKQGIISQEHEGKPYHIKDNTTIQTKVPF